MAKNTIKDVERTSEGLRNALFDELDAVRRGDSKPANANAIARIADQICSTVQLEMEVMRFAEKISGGNAGAAIRQPDALQLGN